MKSFTPLALSFCLTGMTTLLSAATDEPLPGYIAFGELPAGNESAEFVEVNIQRNLIQMIARLAEHKEPEAGTLLRDLYQVRVHVIGLDDSNRETILGRIQDIRQELAAKEWGRIVSVHNGSEDVTVFLKMKSEEAVDGIVVLVVNHPGQAILVNVVGNLRPDKIAELGERLNLPPLQKLGALFKK